MSPDARPFPLAEILSVTTRCLLVPAPGDLGKLLSWMVGESVWSHQLGRVARECEAPILTQHPALANVKIPAWIEQATQQEINTWVAGLAQQYGATLPLTPLAEVDHTSIDPVAEVHMIRNRRSLE